MHASCAPTLKSIPAAVAGGGGGCALRWWHCSVHNNAGFRILSQQDPSPGGGGAGPTRSFYGAYLGGDEVQSAALLNSVNSARVEREMPPLPPGSGRKRGGGKEDAVSEPESAGNPSKTAISNGSEAAMRELASTIDGSVPDMHGLTSNISKAGQRGRSVYPDSNLAEAWLNEVLDYGAGRNAVDLPHPRT